MRSVGFAHRSGLAETRVADCITVRPLMRKATGCQGRLLIEQQSGRRIGATIGSGRDGHPCVEAACR